MGVAGGLFDVPIAAISLVEANRQWFKAIAGFEIDEAHRATASYAYTILHSDERLCMPHRPIGLLSQQMPPCSLPNSPAAARQDGRSGRRAWEWERRRQYRLGNEGRAWRRLVIKVASISAVLAKLPPHPNAFRYEADTNIFSDIKRAPMDLVWNSITDIVIISSHISNDGGVFKLAVETLDDGNFEWTVQYRIHFQHSGISPTLDVAIAAAEAAVAELGPAPKVVSQPPLRRSHGNQVVGDQPIPNLSAS